MALEKTARTKSHSETGPAVGRLSDAVKDGGTIRVATVLVNVFFVKCEKRFAARLP